VKKNHFTVRADTKMQIPTRVNVKEQMGKTPWYRWRISALIEAVLIVPWIALQFDKIK